MKPFVVLYASPSRLSVLVVVEDAVHVGPLFHRPLPVLERGERGDDQERALDVFHGEEVVEEGDGLDGLSQAHLVSQDGVPLLVPGLDEPVEAVGLVGAEDLVVLVDERLVLLVLVGLLLLPRVVEEELVLDLRDLRIRKLRPLLGVVLDVHQDPVLLPLRVHERPRLLPQRLVVVLELVDLVGAADHALQLPGGLAVAQVLPLYHVQPVDLQVEVQRPHVRQVDVVVGVLQVLLSAALVVLQPAVAETSGVDLLQLFLFLLQGFIEGLF